MPRPTPTPSLRTTRRAAAGALGLLLAAGAVGCGTTSTASPTTTGTAAPATTTRAATAPAAFCDGVVAYNAASAEAPRDPAEIPAFAKDVLAPKAKALAASAPAEAQAAIGTLTAAVDEVATTGNPEAMGSPELTTAQATVGEVVHEGCGFGTVSVTATEYQYAGLPREVDAGPTSFELTNKGAEEHEMVLMKRAAGASETLSQLLELPEEEQMAKMTFTGVAFGGSGSTSYTAVDLSPGTYFLICFIPVGGGGAGGEDEPAGPPHFMKGMQATFTVS